MNRSAFRSAFILASLVLASGCASETEVIEPRSLPELAHENQSNIATLSVGMAKAEVLKIMGRKSAQTRDGPIANPFKSETFQDKAGVQYEVLYYVTERNRRFQPLRLGNTTPIVLKDSVLLGWGYQTLSRVRTR